MGRRWTFMVYLAGDNNLEEFGRRDLAEMKEVGSTNEVDVVAQFDTMGNGRTRRYRLTADPFASDVVDELPETNTGDPRNLLEFVRWGLARFPAEHAALVLWNHGLGWRDDDIYRSASSVGLATDDLPRSLVRGLTAGSPGRSLFATSAASILRYPAEVRGILFDDTSKDFLDSGELTAVLDQVLVERGGEKLDLLGFDACLMNMIEIAYQVRHACAYMVGSQEVEPADGWPYGRILRRLTDSPGMSPGDLAGVIVDSFVDHYAGEPSSSGRVPARDLAPAAHGQGAGRPVAVTQSAVRSTAVEPLVELVGAFADGLMERLEDPVFRAAVLMPAMREVQKFRDRQVVDLCDLSRLVAIRIDPPLRDVARELMARFDPGAPSAAVASSRRYGEGVQHAYGLSAYVPFLGPVSPAYAGLAFARDCSWERFLRVFAAS